VEREISGVDFAASIAAGSACALATELQSAGGRFFCKGNETSDPDVRFLRNEIRVNPFLPAWVPKVLWTVETAGWLLAGFEYVEGRHADFSDGSHDLGLIFDTLARNAKALTPSVARARSFGERWDGLVEPDFVRGNTMVHTDMSPRNFLIHRQAALVDWASPALGAAWLDAALIVPRLIAAGHSPASAEGWARRVPAFAEARDDAVTAVVAGMRTLWERQQERAPAGHRGPLITAARSWAEYRTVHRLE
jgi:hypothetical protein